MAERGWWKKYVFGTPLGLVLMLVWHMLSVLGLPLAVFLVYLFFGVMGQSTGPHGDRIPVYSQIADWLATDGGNTLLRFILDFLWFNVAPWFFIPLGMKLKRPTLTVAVVVCAAVSTVVGLVLMLFGLWLGAA